MAHRAGNHLPDLRAAEQNGVRFVEADVRLYRSRLEIRHLKTVGPLPILWDRWRLAAPWRARLGLRELVAATGPDTELVLDLKGSKARIAELVLDVIGPHLGDRRFTICARRWGVLEPFASLPVRSVYSVGSARELRRLLRRFAGTRLDGVSIHERLLDVDTVASLRAVADLLLTWPVNRPERARELLRLGIDGLITDDVAALLRPRALGAVT